MLWFFLPYYFLLMEGGFFVGNVWAIEMQLNQSFFAVEWSVESMRGPIPFSVESTAVDQLSTGKSLLIQVYFNRGFNFNKFTSLSLTFSQVV